MDHVVFFDAQAKELDNLLNDFQIMRIRGQLGASYRTAEEIAKVK